MKKTPTSKFEESLKRLETIVQQLESQEISLEKTIALFEEGMKLSAACQKQLSDAEQMVEEYKS